MNKKRRIAATVGASALAGTMLVGGAMAYLTDEEQTTNKFTVGRVRIDLKEPKFPGNGSDATLNLTPNQEIPKDPTVENTGKNDTLVFASFTIPMAKVIATDENGARQPLKNQELFQFTKQPYVAATANAVPYTGLADYNSLCDGWKQIDKYMIDASGAKTTTEDDAVAMKYVVGYDDVVSENEKTTPIFETVRLINLVEDQIDDNDSTRDVDESLKQINVQTYAIQADNVIGTAANGATSASLDAAVGAHGVTEAMMKDVFNIYVKQNETMGDPAEADSTPDQTLNESTTNIQYILKDTHLRLNTGDARDATSEAETIKNYTGVKDGASSDNLAVTYGIESETPADGDTSSHVVRVDGTGKVTGLKEGTAVVYAKTTNPDTNQEVKATVTVYVQDVNRQ